MSIPNNSKEYLSTIARFDPIENSWTKLGNLKVPRRGHGVIQVDNEFVVLGGIRYGHKDEPTESCKLNGQSITCSTREPKLYNFAYYPELMLIPGIQRTNQTDDDYLLFLRFIFKVCAFKVCYLKDMKAFG